MIARFAPEARGHGVPEVMDAVRRRGGRIAARVVVVKSVASALCIGTGGSVGREGPIVQVGAALGSTLGRIAGVPERRLRLLVACGAAGAISATFNTPIAGVFFALELILGSFETELVAIVVLASVTADVIGRAAFGDHAFLSLPPFQLASPIEYLLYLGLGVAAAVTGVAFFRVLYGVEDLFDRVLRVPPALRPALGGIGLGVLVFFLPALYGVGYPARRAPWMAATRSPSCSSCSRARSWRPASRSASAGREACSRRPCSSARCSAAPTDRPRTTCCRS